MSRLILVTGPCRSGKSAFAVGLARELERAGAGEVTFLATCQAADPEMRQRVAAHQAQRPSHWRLLEESRDLAAALRRLDSSRLDTGGIVLLDCIPTWLGNLLTGMGQESEALSEANVLQQVRELLPELRQCRAGFVLLVTQEVGGGLVPETPLGRCFRDCAGTANQWLAQAAERVYLLSCGQAIEIKAAAATAQMAAHQILGSPGDPPEGSEHETDR